MAIENVINILGQVLTGELDDSQIEQILTFLHAGIDISALMM